MNVLINRCNLLGMLRKFLGPGFEIECLQTASEKFISATEVFMSTSGHQL